MDSLVVYTAPSHKTRIGNVTGDGGYVICDLPGSYDTLISGGIDRNISFEKQLLEKYPDMQGYGFDGTITESPDSFPNFQVIFKNVGDINTEKLTDLVEYFGDANNVFLKLDIEGCEFQVVPSLAEKGLMHKVKQFVLEVHTPCDIKRFPDYYASFLQQYDEDHMFNMLRTINKTHTLVHLHANNVWHGRYPDNIVDGAVLPFVFELTYIRNDYCAKKTPNTDPLPTPLDRKNSPIFPDWKLEGWPYSH